MGFRTNKMPVLQEKSASGAIATFNTALAMPLVNGEFTIQAYQEGSGDPSPVNVRNIVPINAINITKTGVNMFDYSNTDIRSSRIVDYSTGNLATWGSSWNATISYIPVVPNVEYELYNPARFSNGGTAGIAFYDKDYQFISGKQYTTGFIGYSLIFTTPQNAYYMRFCGTDLSQVSLSPNKPLAYIPYNGEVKTVDLGEDVYGGSYNSATGDKRKTWNKKTVGELSFTAQSGNRFTATISDCVNTPNFTGFLCSTYKPILVNANNNTWLSNRVITIVDNRYTTATEFKEAMGDTQIVYPIAEPIESNIGATPIETYDGSNNIFCDTGDTSLTYKDLDIAKRGNFREVFKLPS